MAPPGCLSRCRPRGSVHRRGRARHLPPPPRRPSRGPGSPSVARRCAREDDRGSGRPAGAETRPDHRARSADPAGRPRRRRRDDRSRHPPPPPPHQPGGGSHARGARTRPGTPGGSALGVPPLREGPLGPRAGFRRPAKGPLPGAGRAGGAASSGPRRRPRHPVPRRSPSAADECDGRTAGRRSTGEGARAGAGAPPGGAVPSTPPSRHPGGSRAPRGESRARAPRVRTGDRRSAAPAAAAEGSGPAAPATLRRGRTGGRPAQAGGGRGGKQPAAAATSAPRFEAPVATRGVARGEPRPRARCRARATLRRAERLLPPVRDPAPGWGVPRASISFSLGLRRAARGGLGQRAAAPSGRACGPRGRPRPAAGGRASETERACVDAARAPPAGRHGKRGGRQPPTDSQVRPSSRHSGRAVADPAGADPRTSLNHPIGSSDGRINQVAATHGGATAAARRAGPPTRPGPHRRTPRPNPDRPGSFAAPTRGSGIADATAAAWRRRAPAAAGRPAGDIAARRRLGRGTGAPPAGLPLGDGRPRRPALPATPRRDSASRSKVDARDARDGTRPGLTRPQSRPARRPAAQGASDRPPARLGRAGPLRERAPFRRGPPPGHAVSSGRARGDSDPSRRARPGHRGPLQPGRLALQQAAERQRSGVRCTLADRALSPVRTPSVLVLSPSLSLGSLSAQLQPHRRPALLATGTHGALFPDRGRHRHLSWFLRTPEGSRGHAAVTQLGTVKTPFPGSGRGDTSPATGSELERRPPCPITGPPPWLPHDREAPAESRPAGGPSPTRPEKPHRSGAADEGDAQTVTRAPSPRGSLGLPFSLSSSSCGLAPPSLPGLNVPEAADAGGAGHGTTGARGGAATRQRFP
ncbi:collagen alpha-1(I) chain-like [Passer domesticus]|uniref:collagen alpha-1(I) chain-like n=1 Tax=Passer domesticus TaxID=48849 RepID=UPI0030FE9916